MKIYFDDNLFDENLFDENLFDENLFVENLFSDGLFNLSLFNNSVNIFLLDDDRTFKKQQNQRLQLLVRS